MVSLSHQYSTVKSRVAGLTKKLWNSEMEFFFFPGLVSVNIVLDLNQAFRKSGQELYSNPSQA